MFSPFFRQDVRYVSHRKALHFSFPRSFLVVTHTESHFENEPTARFEIDPCTRPLNHHLTHLAKLERSKTLLIRFCFQYLEPSCAPTIRVRNPGSSHSLCTAAAQAGETVFADRAIRVNALCRGESLRSFFSWLDVEPPLN